MWFNYWSIKKEPVPQQMIFLGVWHAARHANLSVFATHKLLTAAVLQPLITQLCHLPNGSHHRLPFVQHFSPTVRKIEDSQALPLVHPPSSLLFDYLTAKAMKKYGNTIVALLKETKDCMKC